MVGRPVEERYAIVGSLGQSEVAATFVARGTGDDHDRWWILKMPRRNILPTERDARGFVEECQTLSRLAHDNLGAIADAGAFSPDELAAAPAIHEHLPGDLAAPYVAFPYLPGETLARVLTEMQLRERLMVPELAAYLMAAVCDAIEYALGSAPHVSARPDSVPRGVVHGNLGKHNIYVTFHGAIKVLDIGMEGALHLDRVRMAPTMKSVAHLAPERVIGEPASHATDLYSIGVLLWEAVSGMPLYRGRDVLHTLEIIRKTQPPNLSTISPEIPQEYSNIVKKALAKNPIDRYSSAYEMSRDLRAFLGQKGAMLSAPELARIMLDLFGARALEVDPTSRMTPIAAQPSSMTRHASVSRASVPPPGPSVPPRRNSNVWAEAAARRDAAEPRYESKPPHDPRGASFLDAGLQSGSPRVSVPPARASIPPARASIPPQRVSNPPAAMASAPPRVSFPPKAASIPQPPAPRMSAEPFDMANLRRPPTFSGVLDAPSDPRPMTSRAEDIAPPSDKPRVWPILLGVVCMAASVFVIWSASQQQRATTPPVVFALPDPPVEPAQPLTGVVPVADPVVPTATTSTPAADAGLVFVDLSTKSEPRDAGLAYADAAAVVLDAGAAVADATRAGSAATVARPDAGGAAAVVALPVVTSRPAPREKDEDIKLEDDQDIADDSLSLAETLARDGRRALKLKEMEKAEKLLNDCVQYDGPTGCWRDLAYVLEKTGRHRAAAPLYRHYLELEPAAKDKKDIEKRLSKLVEH